MNCVARAFATAWQPRASAAGRALPSLWRPSRTERRRMNAQVSEAGFRRMVRLLYFLGFRVDVLRLSATASEPADLRAEASRTVSCDAVGLLTWAGAATGLDLALSACGAGRLGFSQDCVLLSANCSEAPSCNLPTTIGIPGRNRAGPLRKRTRPSLNLLPPP